MARRCGKGGDKTEMPEESGGARAKIGGATGYILSKRRYPSKRKGG